MMTNHKYTRCLSALVALGLTAGVAASCTNLDETPYAEITSENFHPTSQDIGSLMAPAYTALRPLWLGWYGNIDLQEESSDELITPVRPNGWYDGGTYIRMHKHTWNSHQGQPASLWYHCFDGINAANRVIYQISSGVVPISSDSVKTRTLAELRAIRAYYYYLLLDNFGNVPIVTDFKATDLPQQSTRQQVYDFVVKELTDVIPQLSEQTGDAMYGRMNKWSALTLLAKVYLNAGVYTGTPEWQKVVETTQKVIDSGKYILEPNYRANFARYNESSRENIFVVVYDAINARESSFHMKTLKPVLQQVYDLQAQPWGGSSSAPQFIDTYQAGDKRLPETWLMGPQVDAAGDTLITFIKDVPSMDSTQFYNGYPVWKYEIYAGETGSSDVDYPVFRYADVLMMKAEALLRMGNAGEAATIVTQVRQRDFDDPSKAVVTGAELMQGSSFDYGWWQDHHVVNPEGGADVQYGRMLDELGWEFAAEGHRRQDMIRFGVYTTKTWFNHTPQGDYHRIFPIPQSALNTNPNLQQNPGY